MKLKIFVGAKNSCGRQQVPAAFPGGGGVLRSGTGAPERAPEKPGRPSTLAPGSFLPPFKLPQGTKLDSRGDNVSRSGISLRFYLFSQSTEPKKNAFQKAFSS